MKKLLFIYFFLLLSSIIYGQSSHFDIKETPPFKDQKRDTYMLNVHQLNQGKDIVAVRAIKKDFIISTFDDNYTLLENIEFEKENKEDFIGSITVDNKVLVFTSHKVDKKNIDVYSWTFIPGSKKITKKKLYSQETGKRKKSKFMGWFEPVTKKYNENFRVSPNGKHLAFSIDNIANNIHTSAIRVYDSSLNEVFNKVYAEESNQSYVFDDFVITNEKEVITTGKLYKKEYSDKKKGEVNYQYMLYKITNTSSSNEKIDLGDNFIQELNFAQDDSSVRLMGFYSEKKSSLMKGGISLVINDSDITNVKPVITPFPAQIYSDLYPEARAERLKKKEKELKNYYLDYSVVDDEGNGYLTAEEFYITTDYMDDINGGGHTVTTYHYGDINGVDHAVTTYHYGNILAIKFDNQGKIIWGRSILKKSNSPSYNVLENNGELHLFLNTGRGVEKKSDGIKKFKKSLFDKSALYDVVFDPKGNLTYEFIRENGGTTNFFNPYTGSYDLNTFIMPNFSKNKKKFLILTKKE